VRVAVTRVAYTADGWGVGELWRDGVRLLWHELPRPGLKADSVTRDPLAERMRSYFAGEPDDFRDVAIDLDWCTPFQRAMAEALRAVPRGETVTYGELAALGGRPNAPRAAGSFCAHNRFGLVVPCHRVVAAGGLGAYGSLGQEYKRRLLELEGAL
jgi:methylated-DNA-[protein]-cysteine S-methyltransferase